MKLNELMQFGHVVQIHDNGTVTDAPSSIDGPEVVYLQLDEDGQSLDDEFIDVPHGWTVLNGYSGQYSYSGPVMHPSEYIGGDLERDIMDAPGYYVTAVVDGLSFEDNNEENADTNIGWAVFMMEVEA